MVGASLVSSVVLNLGDDDSDDDSDDDYSDLGDLINVDLPGVLQVHQVLLIFTRFECSFNFHSF
jgi:hypothetical protein